MPVLCRVFFQLPPEVMMHHNKGSALISALLITAIAAMITTALLVQERLLIHQGELVLHADQDYLNLQGMQFVAKNAVKNYVNAWAGKTPIAPLPTSLPVITMNNRVIVTTIDNEQSKFNINDLLYASNQPRFIVLLQNILPNSTTEQATQIAKAITTSITTEINTVRELRAIPAITPALYAALKPYITALPVVLPTPNTNTVSTTQIDLNSMSAPVLLSANSELNMQQAQSLILCRDQYGVFATENDFMRRCAKPMGIATLNDLAVANHYFLIHINGKKNNHPISLESLLMIKTPFKTMTAWQRFK